MALYFGRSGAMVVLPDPDRGVPLNPVRRTAEHLTLGGARAVDLTGHPRLDITLKWWRLTAAELAPIEEFHSGAAGLGPWWLLPIDVPGWNFAHPITAAATSLTADTSGWSPGPGSTLASVTSPVLRGPRALLWRVPADAAATRRIGPDGVLVPQVLPLAGTGTWTFTVDARTLTGSAVLAAALFGSGFHDGPDTTINAGGWTQVSVTYTPPAAENLAIAIGVRPGAAVDVVVDRPRLTYGPGAKPWTPGRSVPQVTITDLAITAVWTDAFDVTLSLREVG